MLKAIVQKTISYLPGSHSINFLFQKYVTKGIYLTDEYFFDRLSHAKRHITSYEKLCAGKPLNTTLELGTGWYPVVPISLYLYGVTNINTIDISELMTKESLHTTIKRFLEAESNGVLANYIKISPERLAALKLLNERYESFTLNAALSALNIKCHVKDARDTGFSALSFDMIHSNNTFEHIYPQILIPILKEFKRIVRKGGLMSHAVDMSDHFAHFDKTINVFNFLRFSDSRWKMIDNSIQPQSRLRVSDYRTIYRELGIPITLEETISGSVAELDSLKLNTQYQSVKREDLVAVQCYFASLMP